MWSGAVKAGKTVRYRPTWHDRTFLFAIGIAHIVSFNFWDLCGGAGGESHLQPLSCKLPNSSCDPEAASRSHKSRRPDPRAVFVPMADSMIVMSRAPEASGQGRATEGHDEGSATTKDLGME